MITVCSVRINKIALRYYMDYFDFTGLRLDVAFRRLCAKLYLKAETQQVDRILEEFSRRYWEQNNTTVYGSASKFSFICNGGERLKLTMTRCRACCFIFTSTPQHGSARGRTSATHVP